MASLVGIVTASRVTFFVASCLTVTGCVMHDVGYRRAYNLVEEGKTEQDLLAAGVPTRTTDASTLCVNRGGVRELHYDAEMYIGGLKAGVHRTVVACLDGNRTVVARLISE